MKKQRILTKIKNVSSSQITVSTVVDNSNEPQKSIIQEASTIILWLSVFFTAVMMVACGTLLVAQISSEYIAYQEFSKQAYIVMMLSYVLLLAASVIDSKLNGSTD